MTRIVLLTNHPPTSKEIRMMSSLADKLKMPMGDALPEPKSVDDHLDDQYGDYAEGDGPLSKKVLKKPLGEATVEELQAALKAKKKEQPEDDEEEDEDEGDHDGDADDGSDGDDY